MTAVLTPVLAWIATATLQAMSKLPGVPSATDLASAAFRVGPVVAVIGVPLCALVRALIVRLARGALGNRGAAFLTVLLMIPVLWYLAFRCAVGSYSIMLLRSDTVTGALALACLISALLLIVGCHVLYPSAPRSRAR